MKTEPKILEGKPERWRGGREDGEEGTRRTEDRFDMKWKGLGGCLWPSPPSPTYLPICLLPIPGQLRTLTWLGLTVIGCAIVLPGWVASHTRETMRYLSDDYRNIKAYTKRASGS